MLEAMICRLDSLFLVVPSVLGVIKEFPFKPDWRQEALGVSYVQIDFTFFVIYRVEHDEIIRIGGRWRNEECRPLDNQLDEASKGGKRRNGACEDDRETVSGLVPLSMNGDEEPEE